MLRFQFVDVEYSQSRFVGSRQNMVIVLFSELQQICKCNKSFLKDIDCWGRKGSSVGNVLAIPT